MIAPETQFTKVDDSWIGYQIVGDGPIDLLFMSGMASNIEAMWDWPAWAEMLERLASYSRLILFDPRGSGISDRIPQGLQTWEHITTDVGSVLNAAKSERAALLAQYDASLSALMFAATFPKRTSALVVWNGYARALAAEDYPMGATEDEVDALWDVLDEIWGRPAMVGIVDPSRADDSVYIQQGAKFLRLSSSPGRALEIMRYYQRVDARPALATISVPTLVMHTQNNWIPMERGRYVADHIAGARFVEVPTADLNLCGSEVASVMDEIEEFLTGSKRAVDVDRVLATVLFTDIVGSTEKASSLGDRKWKELLARHDRIARDEVDRFKGRLVTTTGDGILATFDGPGRAIRCATALSLALEMAHLQVRSGLHTGEIELREDDDIGGIAVHIASRVMREAAPGEVVCSRTVKDLVVGSEFGFEDRGTTALKGVPDEWQLYAVTPS